MFEHSREQYLLFERLPLSHSSHAHLANSTPSFAATGFAALLALATDGLLMDLAADGVA
ncbi:MAG: hypothetical protein ACJAZO_005245, partial [Myxococcota bacterium]